MAIENFLCARHSLVSVLGPTMVGPRLKVFKIKVLRRLENAFLRLVVASTVLHKIAILLMFCRQNSQKLCCTFLHIQIFIREPFY